MDFFKILNARESTYQKFYVELINEKPPNYEVFWLWLDFFANPWMNERVVPDNFFVEVTTGFTMIGWFLGESSQPRGCPYYLERAKTASKKHLNMWLKNAILGQIWAVGPNLNTIGNIMLIEEMWATNYSSHFVLSYMYFWLDYFVTCHVKANLVGIN